MKRIATAMLGLVLLGLAAIFYLKDREFDAWFKTKP